MKHRIWKLLQESFCVENLALNYPRPMQHQLSNLQQGTGRESKNKVPSRYRQRVMAVAEAMALVRQWHWLPQRQQPQGERHRSQERTKESARTARENSSVCSMKLPRYAANDMDAAGSSESARKNDAVDDDDGSRDGDTAAAVTVAVVVPSPGGGNDRDAGTAAVAVIALPAPLSLPLSCGARI